MGQALKQGEYTLLADCPECGFTVHFPVELVCRLTVDDQGSSLRAVMRAKSRDHACGTDSNQAPLPFLATRDG
jgi:hypothetical protein